MLRWCLPTIRISVGGNRLRHENVFDILIRKRSTYSTLDKYIIPNGSFSANCSNDSRDETNVSSCQCVTTALEGPSMQHFPIPPIKLSHFTGVWYHQERDGDVVYSRTKPHEHYIPLEDISETPTAEEGLSFAEPLPTPLPLVDNAVDVDDSADPAMCTPSIDATDLKSTTHMSPLTELSPHANTSPRPSSRLPQSLPIDRLKSFLSPQNLSLHTPDMISPEELQSIYLACEADHSLSTLKPREFSSIISLMGYIALPRRDGQLQFSEREPEFGYTRNIHTRDGYTRPRRPIMHTESFGLALLRKLVHSLNRDQDDKSKAGYWSFLLKVVGDKEKVSGQAITLEDRYWVLRALLAQTEFLRRESGDHVHDDPSTTLEQAKIIYNNIRTQSSHPDIHVPYLRALLSSSTQQNIQELVDRLSWLIKEHTYCHPRLLEVLWEVVTRPDLELSVEQRQQVAKAVTLRASNVVTTSEPDKPLKRRSPKVINAIHIGDIGMDIRDVIFAWPPIPLPGRRTPPSVFPYMESMIKAIVLPQDCGTADPLNSTYQSLVFLAMLNLPLGYLNRSQTTLHVESGVRGALLDFRIISNLIILERMLRSEGGRSYLSLSEPFASNIGKLALRLWRSWSELQSPPVTLSMDSTTAPSRPRPRLISSVVVASFLYIAGRSRNKELLLSCQRYCSFNSLVFVDDTYKKDVDIASSMRMLSLEYLIAAMQCGYDAGTCLMSVLETYTEQEVRSDIIEHAICRIAEAESSDAIRLAQLASQQNIKLGQRSKMVLAVWSGRDGNIKDALQLLQDCGFEVSWKNAVLKAICQSISRDSFIVVDHDLATRVLDAVVQDPDPYHLSHPPTRAFENALLTLADLDLQSRIYTLVQDVTEKTSSSFSSSFCQRFLKLLLRQRMFQHAYDLLHTFTTTYPTQIRHWRRMLIKHYSKVGQRELASKLRIEGTLDDPKMSKQSLMIRLGRMVGFEERRPQPVKTLRLSSFFSRSSRRATIHAAYAVNILSRAHRRRAAMALYDRIRSSQSDKSRTMMGNGILAELLRHRRSLNKGDVRKVFKMRNELIKTKGFIPDQVTFNILIHALLRWTRGSGALTNAEILALFDMLVQNGYPTGGALPSGSLPFGIPPTTHLRRLPIPQIKPPTSFWRHIKPLYELFIKALKTRKDNYGAEKISMILDAVKQETMIQWAKRERARKVGRKRAEEKKKTEMGDC
ncbi:hypothetical protein C8Q75DRAFT_895050 [Abortiporus biennis]|nr:hypothetical protein C8Q75DRAFT_895050 [Abortiporus biennis]